MGFIHQLDVEPPVLSVLTDCVFFQHRAGWPHWSQGSLPDIIQFSLACLAGVKDVHVTTCAAGNTTTSIKETDILCAYRSLS